MTEFTLYHTNYDRSSCETGVAHIGLGAFHRAHQAVYIDDAMQATGDTRWGIAAVNLRAQDSGAFQDIAAARDGYVVKTIAPDGTQNFRLVRSHVEFVDAAADPDAGKNLFARPSLSLATITVTESGYYLDNDGKLDLDAAPVAAGIRGENVETIYAFLAQALAHRAATINAPITIMCCDNIRSNGKMLEGALITYIEARNNTALADWVRTNVTFPCSMVDRITPRSSPSLQDEISRINPDHDTPPDHAETYLQ
ncbi:MAG: mannitol dehydrogenase family protein, partial [Alphaproteobacteria bacterium]|nr:mannitol dehydrogenase family protein [Alphaproteobacteria bacterium]